MGTITLHLDDVTVRDLYNALFAVGEHIAAGAPISPPSLAETKRLAAVMDSLAAQLRITPISAAMRESPDPSSRSDDHGTD
jgi:hypothetical protein